MNQNKSLIEEARLKKKAKQDDSEIKKQVEQIRVNIMHRHVSKHPGSLTVTSKANNGTSEYQGARNSNMSQHNNNPQLGRSTTDMFAVKSRPETGFLSKAVTFYDDDLKS